VVNWPKSREYISRGGSTYSRLMLGVTIRDVTGGYRAFRKETLLGLGMDDVASAGYCFQVDLAWRAVKAGFHVIEVPITFVERERGDSKMSRNIVAEALLRVTAWGISSRAGKLTGGKPSAAAEAGSAGDGTDADADAEADSEADGVRPHVGPQADGGADDAITAEAGRPTPS
jgi:dolichol-phosphate mannosyltransferase